MTIEEIKDIRIAYSKLANLVYKWFSTNYNLTDFYIRDWEFDTWKDDVINIVYEDIFRFTHCVDVTYSQLTSLKEGA